ncbi:MAG: inositol phosphorylceramide synthase [Pedosphaera sp.]|nr:inositol phosphorylceramide synthase [Pedosphaera sp.]
MRDESSADFGVRCWRRITTLWPRKLALTVIVNVLFWSFYFFLSRHALRPVHTLAVTWLDRWAGFQPTPWAWVYESIFLLTGITPLLIVSREELRRYVIGFALLSGVCFVTFALFPVASPRPANLGENTFLIFITRMDGPLNAFPSLHAGCLVYTLVLVRRLFGRRLKPAVTVVLLVWAALILFATLATKQHYALDLLAGGLIGWTADWLAWRGSDRADIASVKTRRKSGVASQAG